MKLSSISCVNSISFKQIILNDEEKRKSDKLLQSLVVSDNKTSQVLKSKLYDLYCPYIEKEIEEKTKFYHFKEDFAQEMFLKFFEALDNIKITTEALVESLNQVKPEMRNDPYRNVSVETKINDKTSIKDVITNNMSPAYLSSKSEEEKLQISTELNDVLASEDFKDVDNYILQQIRNYYYR